LDSSRYFMWLREQSDPFSPHGFGRPTGKDMAIDVPAASGRRSASRPARRSFHTIGL